MDTSLNLIKGIEKEEAEMRKKENELERLE